MSKEIKYIDNLNETADLYMRGVSNKDISITLGISRATVTKHIRTIIDIWVEDGRFSIAEKVEAELNRINNLESEAWTAFFGSRKTKTATITKRENKRKKSRTDKDCHVDQTVTTEYSAGDARFLAIIQNCQKMRIDIIKSKEIPKDKGRLIEASEEDEAEKKKQESINFMATVLNKYNSEKEEEKES